MPTCAASRHFADLHVYTHCLCTCTGSTCTVRFDSLSLLIPATLLSIIILMNNWWRALKYKGKTAGRYLVQADRMHVITTQLTVQCSSIQYSVHTLYMYSTYVIRTPHTHWLSLFNKTTPKMARALACSTRGVAGIDVLGNPVCDRARGGYFVACKMQSY